MQNDVSRKRLRWLGAAWVAILGPWFFLVYGWCNHVTSKRTDVGAAAWDWEKHIPFIPEFIVPYMSLDLFFVIAFFLPKSQQELTLLGKRVFSVITLSALCFLLFPLQFAYPRPSPTDWTGPWFKVLHMNDLPFNMAPSLHISQRCLLWITFGRHLTGMTRTAVRNWFILIGISTLVTWQHHFLDVVTGFLMAYAIMALWPDPVTQPNFVGDKTAGRPLAKRYGAAALACACAALPGGGWLWFGWPAIALGLTSLAYFTGNTRWLQKSSGTPSPAVEWIFLPVTLVARAWQRRWMVRKPAFLELTPGVFFGRILSQKEATEFLAGHPCLTVIDLTSEAKEATAFRERSNYLSLPVLDLTPPPANVLEKAVEAIRAHSAKGPVYVHCLLGIGRTAYVAGAWLAATGKSADFAEGKACYSRSLSALHTP